jgi:hypothetical protein
MYFLVDKITETSQRFIDKLRYANKVSHELLKLSDRELGQLGLIPLHVPFVSLRTAFRRDK